MPRFCTLLFIAALAIGGLLPNAWAAGDPARGKSLFNRCSLCHATTAQNKMGPSLAGVVGREAGTVPGFDYSKAMTNSHVVWNDQALDAYLTRPSQLVPRTSMMVSVPAAQDRQDIIAYLKTLEAP
jgi:cytochrome c